MFHAAAVAVGLAGTVVLALAPAASAGSAQRTGACAAGQLCLWPKAHFKGQAQVAELEGTTTESCVPLPEGASALSLANRTGHPVTTYQSATCGETGEFQTYPSGTWAPESPYVVRAYKVWER
ncbi:peptidase inhibitor family I36 protein [Streptomyces sp. NPDC049555]|uniref:peptidase inhibitor family I36 protein n=1 Tax=unclassified Streptomyces TaxID=2593676 RepID=UPI003418B429